jgi:putative transposase
MRIREIANTRIRYGFKRIFTLMRREGFSDNHKRVYRIYREGCKPVRIQCNNGTEFVSKDVYLWSYSNGVTMDFSRLGKPTDNPYVESFNGKFKDECLNVNWFLSLEDAAKKIEDFRWEYNHCSPRSLTPKEFIILHENSSETLI